MRIDWTQTLLGSSASLLTPSEGHGEGASTSGDQLSAADLFNATRLAGVLVASCLIGLAIVVLPGRGASTTLADILGLSGFLVANVSGFTLRGRLGPMAASLCSLLALPFVIAAGTSGPIMAALATLLLLDMVLTATAAGRARIPTVLILAVGSFIAAAASLFAAPGLGGTLLVVAAFAPIVVTCGLVLRLPVSAPSDFSAAEIARLTALVNASTHGGRRETIVTDVVGTIDSGTGQIVCGPSFGEHLQTERFPERSVVAATLIADRVVLLNALSRAIHQGERTDGIEIRLRRELVGAGYPTPPRYDAFVCSVHPMPGVKGRAAIALEAVDKAEAADLPLVPIAITGSAHNVAGTAMLARALHDCNGPFNAGLGFLEMIADPRLAPRDIATYRDFAAEAHKAISDAHRNSVLLGRWLRIMSTGPEADDAPAEITPDRLLSDAARMLNLRDAVEKGEIRFTDKGVQPSVRLRVESARFAAEVLMRFAQGQMGSEIRSFRQTRDLVINCRVMCPEGDEVQVDSFQLALEAAATVTGSIRFTAEADGSRSVTFSDAYREGVFGSIDVEKPAQGAALIRLAS